MIIASERRRLWAAETQGCERPTCMSNPRILKERAGRVKEGEEVESVGEPERAIYRDTVVNRYSSRRSVRPAGDGVGTRRYATEVASVSIFHPFLSPPFSGLRQLSSRYPNMLYVARVISAGKSIRTAREMLYFAFGQLSFVEIKLNEMLAIRQHGFLSFARSNVPEMRATRLVRMQVRDACVSCVAR